MAEPRFGSTVFETEDGATSFHARRVVVPNGSLQLAEADAADLTGLSNITSNITGVLIADQFGADPTGNTDSTAALQATIDAVETAGGGTIKFGIGRYIVDAPLADVLNSASQLVLPRVHPDGPMISIAFEGVVPPYTALPGPDDTGLTIIESTLSVDRTFTASAATDVLTATAHGFIDGQIVVLMNTGGSLPGGLSSLAYYYVRDKTTDTFKLAASLGGTAIDLTSDGTGTNRVAPLGSMIGCRANHGSGGTTQNQRASFARSWIKFSARNIAFRNIGNPSNSLLDSRFIPELDLDNIRMDVDGLQGLMTGVVPDLQCPEPLWPLSCSLLTPMDWMPNQVRLRNMVTFGHYNGMRLGEVSNADNVEICCSKVGIEFRAASHNSKIGKLLFVASASLIEMAGPDPFYAGIANPVTKHCVDIGQFDFENATGAGPMGWSTTVSHIKDTENGLIGDYNWASEYPLIRTGSINFYPHSSKKPQHSRYPFTNLTGFDLDADNHAVHEIYRGIETSVSSHNAWLVLTTKQAGTALKSIGNVAFVNDKVADGSEKRVAMLSAFTDGAINSGQVHLYTWNAGSLVLAAFWDKFANLGIGKFLIDSQGGTLTIASNTITPTNPLHTVDGAGPLQTITVPAELASYGSVPTITLYIVPAATWSYNNSGNILSSGTAVVNQLMTAKWMPNISKWAMSY